MKTCSVDGCDKPHRARGLCVTHYNQQQPGRYRKVTVPCTYCGEPVVKDARSDGRKPFCDYTCRTGYRREHGFRGDRIVEITCRDLVPFVAPAPVQPRGRRGSRRSRFVSARCHSCGEYWIADRATGSNQERYCSSACRSRAAKTRRRAREAGASVVEAGVTWRAVAARDGLVCWLCHEPCDPSDGHWYRGVFFVGATYPSLDHVVALANGGDHAMANARLAHVLCNSEKGALEVA